MPRRFYILYEQKVSILRPLLSITFPQWFWKSKKFGYWTLGNGASRQLIGVRYTATKKSCSERQNSTKKIFFFCAAILHPLLLKVFKSETTSFHYFFSNESESLNILDIRLWEVGGNRSLNGTSKVKTWTDRQTDTHTRTFQLIESIDPEGQCFENFMGDIFSSIFSPFFFIG